MEPPPALQVQRDQHDLAWQAVLQVLRAHYFTPDQQDMQLGLITTKPLVSQQFFEFWRADAQDWYQWAESSLHTIRRTVQARFEPRQEGYELRLRVTVQRKTMPERQVTTAGQALQMFGKKLPTYLGEPVSEEDVRWVDLGRDASLERYLMGRVARLLSAADAKTAGSEG